MCRKSVLVIVSILVVIVLFTQTGCKLDMKDLSGDWTVETIDGKSPADYAAELDVPEVAVITNYTITESNFIMTDYAGYITLNIEPRTNGFECTEPEKNQIVLSVLYDSWNDILKFRMDNGYGSLTTFTAKRGSVDIDAMMEEYIATLEQ